MNISKNYFFILRRAHRADVWFMAAKAYLGLLRLPTFIHPWIVEIYIIPSDLPLHFQRAVDEWGLAQMMCPFTCDISHQSCLGEYCSWWNFPLCAHTERQRVAWVCSQLEQAPGLGAKEGILCLNLTFSAQIGSIVAMIMDCGLGTDLCSGSISWLTPERLSPSLHWARAHQWHPHHLWMGNTSWKGSSFSSRICRPWGKAQVGLSGDRTRGQLGQGGRCTTNTSSPEQCPSFPPPEDIITHNRWISVLETYGSQATGAL